MSTMWHLKYGENTMDLVCTFQYATLISDNLSFVKKRIPFYNERS